MLSQQIIPNSSTAWRGKVNALEQQNATLSNMYEEILLKYTQVYEECNKYKRLTTKYKNLYINLQTNSTSPDLPYDSASIVNHNNNNNMINYNKSLESSISKLKQEKSEHIAIISQLKNDLSSAQRDILAMTNVVGVTQTLPTVQETMSIFHNIRDQQHHNTCSKLKTFIKVKFKQDRYQKYFVNQLLHEFMFKTLIKCNFEVIKYKNDMFYNLAEQLNMDYTLKQIYYSSSNVNGFSLYDGDYGYDNKQDQDFIDSEKNKILGNRFGSYFRKNYKYILKTETLKKNVMDYMLRECQHFSDLGESNEANECYEEYLVECMEVCWVMLLQEPAMQIMPLQWKPNVLTQYDDRCNKRVLGSDRKCDNILYYVWPNLMRNGKILKHQKTEVITKKELFEPRKLRK